MGQRLPRRYSDARVDRSINIHWASGSVSSAAGAVVEMWGSLYLLSGVYQLDLEVSVTCMNHL